MDKDNELIMNTELNNICECLTKMVEANRYIKNYHYFNKKTKQLHRPADGDTPSVRNEKIKDYQYQFYMESIEFNRLINQYFSCNSRNRLTRLRVDCDLQWGVIHVKQPISPLHHINEGSSRVIILKETISRLRLDLGIGGSDLAYKLNLIDIAL